MADGTWLIEIADPQKYTGTTTSIALDSNDLPHISHISPVKYTHRDSGGDWHHAVVDEGHTNWGTSIALDSKGFIHISCCAGDTDGNLKYAFSRDGVNWQVEDVDIEGDVGRI